MNCSVLNHVYWIEYRYLTVNDMLFLCVWWWLMLSNKISDSSDSGIDISFIMGFLHIGIGITITNLRRSPDRLRFIIGFLYIIIGVAINKSELVARSSYVYNEDSYTHKAVSFYWIEVFVYFKPILQGYFVDEGANIRWAHGQWSNVDLVDRTIWPLQSCLNICSSLYRYFMLWHEPHRYALNRKILKWPISTKMITLKTRFCSRFTMVSS